MKKTFEMVAKTFQGLEDVLAEELRDMGALNVQPGLRMVSFEGDLAMMYRANLGCRTALRILKPILKFTATSTDELYDKIKAYDWSDILTLSKTFSVDSVVYSEYFSNSRYITYRVKDAIVDHFKDLYGTDKRPGVRTQDADVQLNIHIADDRVTLSLDSSGESLHKRGYRVAQTEAPINEVLAAGIILKSGWRGDMPIIDPMCGSGTFLIEGALIAANIMPGIYRRKFAFEQWKDFDGELLDSIYNDDSKEREVTQPIIGADISPAAIAVAERNVKSAGVAKFVTLSVKPMQQWTREEIPPKGVLVANPPYGERISVEDMDNLYAMIGTTLKHTFLGYHAWIIAYREEYLRRIGLAPSSKMPILNGSLPCELREYIIFDGAMSDFRRSGGCIKDGAVNRKELERRRTIDKQQRRERAESGRRYDDPNHGRKSRSPRNELEKAYRPAKGRFAEHKKPLADEKDSRRESMDNTQARRRNLRALKDFCIEKPTLPSTTEVFMRERRRRNLPPLPPKEDNKD